MPLDLNYYYGSEAEQYSFYRIPKTLLTDRRYKGGIGRSEGALRAAARPHESVYAQRLDGPRRAGFHLFYAGRRDGIDELRQGQSDQAVPGTWISAALA